MKYLRVIFILLLVTNIVLFTAYVNSITGYNLSFVGFDSIQRMWFILIFPVFVISLLFLLIYYFINKLDDSDNGKWWFFAVGLNLALSAFLVVQVIIEINKHPQL